MTVFAAMLDALFADASMAVGAVHTRASDGAATPVRAVLKSPDRDIDGFDTRATVATKLAEVRVSELPAVSEGDTLTVDGTAYRVKRAERPDADRLLWRLSLTEA